MLAVCALTGRKIWYSPRQIASGQPGGRFIVDGRQSYPLLCGALLSPPAWQRSSLPSRRCGSWFWTRFCLAITASRHAAKPDLPSAYLDYFILFYPELTSSTAMGRKELWASLSLLGGSFSWALGSVLSKRWQSGMDAFSATGWQVTAAGVANFIFALLVEDFHTVVWTARGIGAVCYLIVCGSWIGYTAYIWLLEHVPTSKVSTYAYVNPVVAVFLGWLVLDERVSGFILAGSAVVVLSVILVTSAKVKEKPAADEMLTELA